MLNRHTYGVAAVVNSISKFYLLYVLDIRRGICPVSGQSGDTNFPQARRVLIMSDELNASATALGDRSLVLIDDLEKEGQGRGVVEPAYFPGSRA